MMPLIVRSLGDRWYGMWTLVGSIIGYYGLLDFGMASAVQTYIARALGKDDHAEIEILVSTAFRVFFIAGMVAFLVAACVGLNSKVFFILEEEADYFRRVMLILGVSSLLQFSSMVFNGLYTANYRYDLTTIIETGKLLLRTALLLAAMQVHFDIVVLALITVGVEILSILVKLIVAKITFGGLYLKFGTFHFSRVRQLMSFGSRAFVVDIANILRFNLDAPCDHHVFITGSSNGLQYRGTAGRIFCAAGQRTGERHDSRICPAIMQKAIGMPSVGFFFLAVKISTCASLFIYGAAVIFGRPFIQIWMGPEYSGSFIVMMILAISSIFHSSLLPVLHLLYGTARHGVYAKVCLLEGIGNLLFSILLVKHFGIYGVAIGTAVPMMIVSVWLIYHVSDVLGVGIMRLCHLRRQKHGFRLDCHGRCLYFYQRQGH